jgi:hypothetical protein
MLQDSYDSHHAVVSRPDGAAVPDVNLPGWLVLLPCTCRNFIIILSDQLIRVHPGLSWCLPIADSSHIGPGRVHVLAHRAWARSCQAGSLMCTCLMYFVFCPTTSYPYAVLSYLWATLPCC